MIYTVSFHPIALEEYKQASIWYESQQEGLGLRFEKAIENKIRQIVHNPVSFIKIKGAYRKAVTQTFPFVIIYKLNSGKHEIYISAVYHTKRNPKGKFRK